MLEVVLKVLHRLTWGTRLWTEVVLSSDRQDSKLLLAPTAVGRLCIKRKPSPSCLGTPTTRTGIIMVVGEDVLPIGTSRVQNRMKKRASV